MGRRGGRARRCAAEWLRFPVKAVIDFVAEDSCLICRRSWSGRTGAGGALEPPACFVTNPVAVRCWLGILAVSNHPVCPRCAASFVPSRSLGMLPVSLAAEELTDRAVSGAAAGDPARRPAAIPVISPFMTTDPVLEIVHHLKFNGYIELHLPVARAIAWAFRRFSIPSPETLLVIPTPMDVKSQKVRGFNQAAQIACALAADLGASVGAGILHKRFRTERQSLTPTERRVANVRGAFACAPGAESLLEDRVAVVVDDLVTSGATARACVDALMDARARSVMVASFGRAL